jgi:CBS domain-containing protein
VAKVENAEKIMTQKVITCSPTDTFLQIQQLMVNNNISRVVVVDENNKPVGIITQKDVINFLVIDKSKRGIEEIKAGEAMSKKLLKAKRKTSIAKIAETMAERDISSVIIVDPKGKLDGIVTKTDITAWYSTTKEALKVQDFMTAKTVTVKPSQSVFLVASLMAEHDISRIVVVADKENKPAGIITEADMTMASRLLKPAQVLKEEKPLVVKGAIAPSKNVYLLTASDIMTSNPVTISKDASLTDAAKLVTKRQFSGLPVTEKGKLVGIITKSDIIRSVAHQK